MKIEQNLVEEFQKNGVVCLKNVFGSKWIELARSGIEKIMKDPSQFSEKNYGEKEKGCYFDDYYNWQRIEEFKKYAFESPAAAIVGALLPDTKEVAFYHEHVLVKEPGTDKETPWHHDQSYYPIDGEKVCSIWMPVDPVPSDTCVQFVAGSHKWGWFLPQRFRDSLNYPIVRDFDREYQKVPDVYGDPEKYDILTWDVQPGDCIVFHMKTLHGAPGNASRTTWRRVLSTRWLGDDAVVASRPWEPSPPYRWGLQDGERATEPNCPVIWRSTE